MMTLDTELNMDDECNSDDDEELIDENDRQIINAALRHSEQLQPSTSTATITLLPTTTHTEAQPSTITATITLLPTTTDTEAQPSTSTATSQQPIAGPSTGTTHLCTNPRQELKHLFDRYDSTFLESVLPLD